MFKYVQGYVYRKFITDIESLVTVGVKNVTFLY